jgi:hypothetical protein
MSGDSGRQCAGVFGGLRFDPDQRMPPRLRLNDRDGLPAGIEEIIRLARQHRELAHGYPRSRRDIHLGPVLNLPTGLGELPVDVMSCELFGVHGSTQALRKRLRSELIITVCSPGFSCLGSRGRTAGFGSRTGSDLPD